MSTPAPPIDASRRAAAIGAFVLLLLVLVLAAFLAPQNLGRIIALPVLALVAVASAWVAATRKDPLRWLFAGIALAAVVAAIVTVLTSHGRGLGLVAGAVLLGGSTMLARYALHRDVESLKAAPVPGTPVPAAKHPVLIMNLKSGGGKAEKFDLEGECRRRGIEPVVLQKGDDLLQLAKDAIGRGADVVGMAGGDGSQALVASVAKDQDVAHVCIPAGTRNHFALDLGLDRDDVVGALDAFGDAVERRIDLAEVGGRVFVNNVSLGVYAKVVQSPEYRDAKGQTTANMLPELLGPDAEPFDLRYTDPDGKDCVGAQIIQVSNNPYIWSGLAGLGSRERIDTGELGIATAEVHTAADVAALVAAQASGRLDRYAGWTDWTAPTFTVESGSPIEAGVDGEALVLDSPLEFKALPRALRIRLPKHAPGYSPAALSSGSPWWTIRALARAAVGKSTPIDDLRTEDAPG